MTRFDPHLTTEAKMRRMKDEISMLRYALVQTVEERFERILRVPYDMDRETSRGWLYATTRKIIEAVEPNPAWRAPCPLCGSDPLHIGSGWAYPNGLERHLLGTHRTTQCSRMYAANGLWRAQHKEQWPGDIGPYGAD